jgi:myosin heavy subunit
MGGIIAFIGDRLGTKVGKKKLSIFGLRPRHTSIIVTIITGFLITALTLGAATLLSENVRIALFGMEQLNEKISDTQKSLATVNSELETLQKEREKNAAELKKAKDELTKADAAAKKAKDEVEAVQADLAASKQQIDELNTVRDALENERAFLEDKVTALNEKQGALERDVEKYTQLAHRLNEGINFIREGDIIYRAGELVVSSIKPPESDRAENERYINALLAGANQQVLYRLGVNQPIEAIWIAETEVTGAIDYLAAAQQDMVVRIVSAGNIVAGEPVRLHTEIYPNSLIYKKNQLVYSEAVKLQKNNEQLLMNYLKHVNTIAVSQGIIPEPLKGAVGVMSGEQFYDIIHDLEGRDAATLSAYAVSDTYASGPLRLDIKIK